MKSAIKSEELNNLIDTLDGVDIPAEIAKIYSDILAEAEQTKNNFANKIDGILCLIQSRKKWLQIRKEEADRLNKLIKKDENTIKFLNDYLLRHLEAQEVTKLRTNKFNLTVANNGGKLPLWIDSKINPKDLPKKYQQITVEINKNTVREALEKGEDLVFAGFSERGKHLRIS
jgi:5,10-methylenetetrahydrofolate reductase